VPPSTAQRAADAAQQVLLLPEACAGSTAGASWKNGSATQLDDAGPGTRCRTVGGVDGQVCGAVAGGRRLEGRDGGPLVTTRCVAAGAGSSSACTARRGDQRVLVSEILFVRFCIGAR
jgi:hypothetical protein